jgi:polysaccharide deacetylase 2 family uncharacterized protein YibQ
LRLPIAPALALLLGSFLLAFIGFALLNDDPLGGEPVAHVALSQAQNNKENDKTGDGARATTAPPSQQREPASDKQTGAGQQKTVTIIDGSSGARQDVVISGKVDDKAANDATLEPAAGIDRRLLEPSRYGLIPVAAANLKPFMAYAADADRAKAAKMPVVSIVIGGLGVGAAKTMDAIMRLPGAVTLAFTPYGADPEQLAERARAQHHEILLQIPMEPYDYPDNDPGPQTLLTSLGPEQNLDRLYWHLSRLQGYAGITNFMGARFVATEQVMQPILHDAAKRGLAFFDDGTAPRSVAAALANAEAAPFAKGDVAIDAVPTPSEIDRALAKLEDLAKERGYAIGTAGALPVSIERIGNWVKKLEAHGLMLVPLTTVMLKSKSS